MRREKTLGEKAGARFTCGYDCSQSVLLTLYESWHDKTELIPKIATAFGGGIGRCGSICGAVTGGVIAIGTRYGTNEPQAEKRKKHTRLPESSCENSKRTMEPFSVANS